MFELVGIAGWKINFRLFSNMSRKSINESVSIMLVFITFFYPIFCEEKWRQYMARSKWRHKKIGPNDYFSSLNTFCNATHQKRRLILQKTLNHFAKCCIDFTNTKSDSSKIPIKYVEEINLIFFENPVRLVMCPLTNISKNSLLFRNKYAQQING